MTKQIILTVAIASLVVFSQLAAVSAAEPAVGQQTLAAENETAPQESPAKEKSAAPTEPAVKTEPAAPTKSKRPQPAAGAIEVLQPKFRIELSQGFSKIIRTKQPIIRVAVPNPEVANVVAFKRKEVGVMGMSPGVTTVTIWIGTKEKSEAVQILVRVENRVAGRGRAR